MCSKSFNLSVVSLNLFLSDITKFILVINLYKILFLWCYVHFNIYFRILRDNIDKIQFIRLTFAAFLKVLNKFGFYLVEK